MSDAVDYGLLSREFLCSEKPKYPLDKPSGIPHAKQNKLEAASNLIIQISGIRGVFLQAKAFAAQSAAAETSAAKSPIPLTGIPPPQSEHVGNMPSLICCIARNASKRSSAERD